jgi:hypothetical protein
MRRIRYKRLLVAASVIGAIAAIAIPAASAASPEPTKLSFSGTFTDPDFCGTGVPVTIDSRFQGVLFQGPTPTGYEFWLTLEGRDVFTNTLTNATVTAHLAGAQKWSFLHDGDPTTPPLTRTLDLGLRGQIVSHGPSGVVNRDAGYVVLQFTYTIFDGHIVVERGPHPELHSLLEAGSDTFCQMMTTALDIT